MKHLLVTNDFPPKIGGIQSLRDALGLAEQAPERLFLGLGQLLVVLVQDEAALQCEQPRRQTEEPAHRLEPNGCRRDARRSARPRTGRDRC